MSLFVIEPNDFLAASIQPVAQMADWCGSRRRCCAAAPVSIQSRSGDLGGAASQVMEDSI